MSNEMLFRAFDWDECDMDVRSAGDDWELDGIAVPYNTEQRIDARLVEAFAPGVVDHQMNAANRVYLMRKHRAHGGVEIGKLSQMRNDTRGLRITSKISKTTDGSDARILMQDKVVDQLSVGFYPVQNRKAQNGTVIRTKVNLFEVAIVPRGAYGENATVTAVRSENETDSDKNMREVIQIMARIRKLPPL
jgi:HK97 family phage prohead protease